MKCDSARVPRCTTSNCDPGKGGQLARAAGVGAQLMAREGNYALLRLPSGEMRKALIECYATVGQVGNLDHDERDHRQGRSQSLERDSPDGSRRGHESGGPPPRWR